MRFFDFTSWQTILTSIAALLAVTMIGMGIRLLMMMTIQQRRERQNRQINERLKALISAYKTLGGSFTGTLTVSPAHMRDFRRTAAAREAVPVAVVPETSTAPADPDPAGPQSAGLRSAGPESGSDRACRIRDAVEASLSDIVLFGTETQVALAAAAMRDMVAGRPVHVAELVVSLRAYIREVLDLDPIPENLVIPAQGPTRPSGASGRGGGQREGGGGRGGGGGMGAGGGMAMGGMGLGVGAAAEGDPTGRS
ncbi:MAG: hypothetical protein AB7I79_06280 [Rhizobiaceae bacterium]